MHYAATLERIEIECKTRQMASPRGELIRLTTEEILVVVTESMNVLIRLMDDETLVT